MRFDAIPIATNTQRHLTFESPRLQGTRLQIFHLLLNRGLAAAGNMYIYIYISGSGAYCLFLLYDHKHIAWGLTPAATASNTFEIWFRRSPFWSPAWIVNDGHTFTPKNMNVWFLAVQGNCLFFQRVLELTPPKVSSKSFNCDWSQCINWQNSHCPGQVPVFCTGLV